ncbi:glycosyltransferase [Coxiella-like endosymbiont of Rhipicephalus sanguineus]|uniref:glycosyltransferase n=1 Tax=Coxiella-like endosymbiont of Rhipicephalus sanguineus TaxID=1955402 RepID=UPI00203AFA30|nr:glycosyltransferase [Coxiella-like endosymbiont of Rhipicephalus sanguineus]
MFNKLDYDLLNQLVKRMKDWKFVFCGKVVFENDQGWENLIAHENVKYLGLMQLEQLREIAYRSTVGIIPFVQKNFIKVSFPLKTYEYLASGLPVVSTPIDNLIKEDKEKVIHFASNVDDFEKAIRQASKERFDKDLLEKRLSTAKRTSYDKRFKLCVNAIVQGLEEIKINPKTIEDKKLNILIFYYPNLKGLENIKNYTKFIKHNVYFLSSQFIAQSIIQEPESLNFFDGLVIDFSAILSNHSLTIFMEYAKSLQNYRGFKILCLREQTSHFQPNLEELIRPHVNILSTKKNKSITFIKKSPIGEINLGTYNNLTNYFLALSTMFNTNVPARRISKPEIIYAHITDLYPRTNKKFLEKKYISQESLKKSLYSAIQSINKTMEK